MVSQAANDLNFTFVVDEAQGDRLVQELHELLIRPVAGDTVLGPTWAELYGPARRRHACRSRGGSCAAPSCCASGRARVRLRLRRCAGAGRGARQLRALKSVGRIFYAMKANPNAELLRIIAAAEA